METTLHKLISINLIMTKWSFVGSARFECKLNGGWMWYISIVIYEHPIAHEL